MKPNLPRFREWQIKEYFSSKDLYKVEQLKDDTRQDKLDIIEEAKKGDQACICYLIIKNHKIFGKFYMNKVFPYASDKNAAFDDFMVTLIQLLFDKSENSVLNKFKINDNVEDPISYFGQYCRFGLQNALAEERRERERGGITAGRVSKEAQQNAKNSLNIELMNDLNSGDESYENSINYVDEVWKTKIVPSLLDSENEKIKKVVSKAFLDSRQFNLKNLAEITGLNPETVRKYLKIFGNILDDNGLTYENFLKLVNTKGGLYIAESLGTKVNNIKPIEKDTVQKKYQGVKKNATEWVEEFLKTNPTGTYKDFLKSDIYTYAMGLVNMRNFNSAKARLKNRV